MKCNKTKNQAADPVILKAKDRLITLACEKFEVEMIPGKDPLELWKEAVNQMPVNLLKMQNQIFEEIESGIFKDLQSVVKARLSELNASL
ncbi:hypothetical protein [Bacillus mesophilum]|uniref:Uncharacterized protein n=1 Tax=Bacillus mesophilum TaxID=1071718 RepID=A0A7V7RNX6_9BACI|nr:hypothetical protein [Bacillus mesophilum]KAB2334291.1 hypothetical protein F7732_09480 [Bacillus mesophilum]